MSREPFAVVVARIMPPSGFSAEQIEAASRKVAVREPEWRREAEAVWPEAQIEQRKYHILRAAVRARDELLTGKRR